MRLNKIQINVGKILTAETFNCYCHDIKIPPIVYTDLIGNLDLQHLCLEKNSIKYLYKCSYRDHNSTELLNRTLSYNTY